MADLSSDAVGNYFLQCPICGKLLLKSMPGHLCRPGHHLDITPDDIEEVD